MCVKAVCADCGFVVEVFSYCWLFNFMVVLCLSVILIHSHSVAWKNRFKKKKGFKVSFHFTIDFDCCHIVSILSKSSVFPLGVLDLMGSVLIPDTFLNIPIMFGWNLWQGDMQFSIGIEGLWFLFLYKTDSRLFSILDEEFGGKLFYSMLKTHCGETSNSHEVKYLL